MNRPRRFRSPIKLSKSVLQQLNLYVLSATAASLGLVSSSPQAKAEIVYTPTNQVVPNDGKIMIDLNQDGVPDFTLANPFRTQSFTGTSSVLAYAASHRGNQVYGRGAFASCLASGVQVGPAGKFGAVDRVLAKFFWNDGSYRVLGASANGGKGVQDHYLGFRFRINNEAHYGWARLNLSMSDSFPGMTATLMGYAYETTPNKAIVTGKTRNSNEASVQPGSLGWLAGGTAFPTVSRSLQGVK